MSRYIGNITFEVSATFFHEEQQERVTKTLAAIAFAMMYGWNEQIGVDEIINALSKKVRTTQEGTSTTYSIQISEHPDYLVVGLLVNQNNSVSATVALGEETHVIPSLLSIRCSADGHLCQVVTSSGQFTMLDNGRRVIPIVEANGEWIPSQLNPQQNSSISLNEYLARIKTLEFSLPENPWQVQKVDEIGQTTENLWH